MQQNNFCEANSFDPADHVMERVPTYRVWSPPRLDYFKLNTDIAKIDDKCWGAAAVVRNHVGSVLGAATWHVRCGCDATVA
ncbi:hypothetical protein SESBI_02555 [Sesbania bispinosa]|nr:hypothetical protein SESBI_02555 [Sesbania bispinosa]